MDNQNADARVAIVEITGNSWEKLAKDNFAEAERLQALNAELLEALERIAWHELSGLEARDIARAILAKAKS